MKNILVVAIGVLFAGTVLVGSANAKPFVEGDYFPIRQRPQTTNRNFPVCLQVITYAKDQFGSCRQFHNSCIPAGWTKVSSCSF